MEGQRQNPDQLLKNLQADETKKSRGQLKIFFGYAAGTGKTYAMLKAAHAARKRGVDVVAGYIEPDTPPKTRALLNGLEQLPAQTALHEGRPLQEFDLDGALARNPRLILVDGLAHSNAEICRHSKRYQDVEELLSAGIDVYTTVNVQHIESLNDMVTSITGVPVRDRIPDEIFDRADQVELVDIEPSDLIERMTTGAAGNPFSVQILTVELLSHSRKNHNRKFQALTLVDTHDPNGIILLADRRGFPEIGVILFQVFDIAHKMKQSLITCLLVGGGFLHKHLEICPARRSRRHCGHISLISGLLIDLIDQLVNRHINALKTEFFEKACKFLKF